MVVCIDMSLYLLVSSKAVWHWSLKVSCPLLQETADSPRVRNNLQCQLLVAMWHV